MIKKTIITAIALFLMYSAFVAWFAPSWWWASQHQWQDNSIKAQQFIYNEGAPFENVIVGSSLSCRIVTDSLPKTYNLSFAGQSIMDGLDILEHAEKLPRNVFIETNFVLRPEDKNFTSSLHSLLYYPKKTFVSLRDDKQPLGVSGKQISYVLTNRIIEHTKSLFHLKNTTKNDHTENNMFPKMLQLQVESYSEIPSASLVKESFENLKSFTAELEKKNIKVIFFEMPVNDRLINMPRANLIRKTFYDYFPKSKYRYIAMPENEKFTTTDGVHLTGDEAMRYTSYLKAQLSATVP